ncbi:MAG: hypothetical protein ABI910_06060 [Gemmatimonadota bacterium]
MSHVAAAADLARFYCTGEFAVVRISGEAEERVRDLVRDLVRDQSTVQREILKSRHYTLEFGNGLIICGSSVTALLISRACHKSFGTPRIPASACPARTPC